VVYGDTDSLFVLLPGRSVAEAFAVGEAMRAKVNGMLVGRLPMELKLEKVYRPSMLVSKKRCAL
jgi:DNA polymerase zeta